MESTRYSVLFFFFVLQVCLSKTSGGCKRNYPGFNDCVVKEMNSFKTTLRKGLPNLKIASLEPFHVPMIRLRQGSGPVSIDLIATDQVFRGITNYEITSANVDLDKYRMVFTVTLPWLHVKGQNRIKGRILMLPIEGKGDGWSNYTMVSGNAILKGHPTKRDGKEFFNLDTVKFDVFVKRSVMHINNLFNGNEQLGEAMNKFMSENWEVVFQEMKPVIDETIQEIIKDIAVKLFKRYSLDEMFPK